MMDGLGGKRREKATAPEELPGGKASGAGAKGRDSLLDELVDDET